VSASFVYDADGNRVKGTVGGVTTVYIAGMYEYQGGATTHYYAPSGHPNALRRTGYGSDNGVFYLLQDHLKSSSAVINQNGTLNSQNYYYPYGGNRAQGAPGGFSTVTTKRFTGQYHEAGLPGGEGLSYYNARWYDARLERFISADPIVPGPVNPQNWNRYTYVRNKPLGYKDPSGHDPWWILERRICTCYRCSCLWCSNRLHLALGSPAGCAHPVRTPQNHFAQYKNIGLPNTWRTLGRYSLTS
jgi:RHS repeat-associated protein